MTQQSYKVNVPSSRLIRPWRLAMAGSTWPCSSWSITPTAGARNVVFGRTVFAPGESVHQLHRHPGAEEVVYLVRRRGVATNGDEEIALEPGDSAFHPQGEWHGFYNTSPTEEAEMIWVWAGASSKQDAGYEVKGLSLLDPDSNRLRAAGDARHGRLLSDRVLPS